jgi:hypothetical protein
MRSMFDKKYLIYLVKYFNLTVKKLMFFL